MSERRQARIVILCDLMAIVLILGVTFRPSEDRVQVVTLLQCKTLPLFDKQGSYERPRGTFRTSLNERRLFLVCTDRVSRQLVLRAHRNQDGRVEKRIPDLE